MAWLAGGWLLTHAILAAAAAAAQAPLATRVVGVVRRPTGRDTVPVAGARVVLHRIGRATQGPLDTTFTAPNGRFSFRFGVDTTASYLLSSRYADIEYFSAPLRADPAGPDTSLLILVFDTSSAARIEIKSRTLVVAAPDAIGARTVVDWLTLHNGAVQTRVGRDSLEPTFGAPMPAGVRNEQLGDVRLSQFSAEAVTFRNDSVLVAAAVSPGEKELLLQYELPPVAGRLELPVGEIDSVEVFLEEPTARVDGPGWSVRDTPLFQGRRFHRFARSGAGAATLTVRFRRSALTSTAALPLLVGATTLLLAVGTWILLRRSPEPTAAPPAETAVLADRIARLDREFAGREADAPEWERYRRERAGLLAELRGALARAERRA